VRRLFCFLLPTAGAVSGAPKCASDGRGQALPRPGDAHPREPRFNQDNFHKLVSDAAARRRMIAAIMAESRKQGYIGFQFDFENIIETDRDALALLVTEAAQAMHLAGCNSPLPVPNAPEYAGEGGFSKWIFANWRAAYCDKTHNVAGNSSTFARHRGPEPDLRLNGTRPSETPDLANPVDTGAVSCGYWRQSASGRHRPAAREQIPPASIETACFASSFSLYQRVTGV
jgi:hypothetical protein